MILIIDYRSHGLRGNASPDAPASCIRDAGASQAAFPRRSVGTIKIGIAVDTDNNCVGFVVELDFGALIGDPVFCDNGETTSFCGGDRLHGAPCEDEYTGENSKNIV